MNKQIKTQIAVKNALYKHLKRKMLNSKLLDQLNVLKTKLQRQQIFFNLNTLGISQKSYLIHPLVLNVIGLC